MNKESRSAVDAEKSLLSLLSLSCAIKKEKKELRDGKEQELRDAIEIDGYETSPKSHFLKLPLLL